MKIALGQLHSLPGDIVANIRLHLEYIQLAAEAGTDMIIFPELSLIGYEPSLAGKLAMLPEDPRLTIFEELSTKYSITIGLGLPLQTPRGVTISMLIFQAGNHRQVYNKKYLHADELPFFVPGKNERITVANYPDLSLAICYEISVPEHAETAAAMGAKLYLASVVKFTRGMGPALDRLSEMANRYDFTVGMVNAVGEADGAICGGRTSIWASDGQLIDQLGESEEGILYYDRLTKKTARWSRNEWTSQRT